MKLTFDIGNTQVSVCLWQEDETGGIVGDSSIIAGTASTPTEVFSKKEEFQTWVKAFLQKQNILPEQITGVGVSSVVPSVNETVSSAIENLFTKPAVFVQSKTAGLKINYDNPEKLGADRIVASLGAMKLQPGKNLIVVDMGTATTIDCISSTGIFLGGVILPGLRISMEALVKDTALLPSAPITNPQKVCGTNTISGIQSGLYYGHAGAIKEICSLYIEEIFKNEKPFIIGTGGFSSLYKDYGLFDQIETHLVHIGIKGICS